MGFQDSRILTYLGSMPDRQHSPFLIISLIGLETVSIFVSATNVYGMYPFRYFPRHTSRRFPGPMMYSLFAFLIKINSLGCIPGWPEATTRPTASRLLLFGIRNG